jgi:hypothetical protein
MRRISSSTPAGFRGWLAFRPRLWRAFFALIVATAVAGTAPAGQAAGKPGVVKVKGTIHNQSFSGPNCASPVDLCFQGEVRGSLAGPDEGVVHALTPTSEPGVVFGDATLTIHDKRGDLICHELFLYNVDPTGDGHFTFLCEITSGTGRYAGASGYLQGMGTASVTTGETTATYRGVIELQ